MDIIPSGSSNINIDALMSDRFIKFLDGVKSCYKYIIFNSPSTSMAEAKILFKYSNIDIFVFKRGISTIDEVEEFNKIKSRYGLDNIGIILN